MRLLLVAALVVLVGCAAPAPPPVLGTDLLGPEPGERVDAYLDRARASWPSSSSGEVWALVQLTAPVSTDAAAALVSGVRVSRVVFRVPLPRVQTALVTIPVPGQRVPDELRDAQQRAAADRRSAVDRAVAGSRQALSAAAEAAELSAGCACVLAILVHADSSGLHAVAARPGVRAVHAATPGLPLPSVAVSPLLPEQTEVAAPVPDDGPIPGPATSR